MGDVGTKLRDERERLGIGIDQIEAETERNRYFTAGEAKEFGLVDEVLIKLKDEKITK